MGGLIFLLSPPRPLSWCRFEGIILLTAVWMKIMPLYPTMLAETMGMSTSGMRRGRLWPF